MGRIIRNEPAHFVLFYNFFMRGTLGGRGAGQDKKRAAESDSLTTKSRNNLPWDIGMEYFSSVMMPIHWAEFYADLRKCQEEEDTLLAQSRNVPFSREQAMTAGQTDVVLFGINIEKSRGCYNPAQHNASTATFAKWYGISNDFERVRNLPLISRLAAQGDTQWHIRM